MIGRNDSYTNKGRHETATTESALLGIAPPPPSAGAHVYLRICFCEKAYFQVCARMYVYTCVHERACVCLSAAVKRT